MVLNFNPTTALKFYYKDSGYVSGQGASSTWVSVISGVLFGEWKGSFGDRALTAQAMGVKDSATVRTFYHPTVYEKLKKSQVLVVKNADSTAVTSGVADKNNMNVYELWGDVDNIAEENRYMEFRVRRYEGK
ncbi:hypothetical protein SDC9_91254 [bioreactor metagenome]|uniref:Uncharacterized protein n=1 Tax=bioreactor metagenome TaxID=1076179 RepID=A0A644ZUL5_9ZZZZ